MYFVLFFVNFFISSMFILFSGKMVMLNLTSGSIGLSFSVSFSLENLMFFMVVSLVAMMIWYYSYYYMEMTVYLWRFKFLFVGFLISMFVLILSNSMILLFVGWDGLGVTSYCLVLFYLNFKALNASTVTMLSNRVGDAMMLVFLMFFWNFNMWDVKVMEYGFSNLLVLVFFVIVFSKSAQFPFSSWLPAAMAAPTPISALVHSSTLVTAGIFLLMKFFMFLSFDGFYFLFFAVFFTLIYSGVSSVFENDFKKIVALSTLSQLSFILLTLSVGLKFLALCHLMTHALFKSLLFLNVGSLIHKNFSSQDKRVNYTNNSWVVLVSSSMSLFNLLAFFSTSGFYSKDMILEGVFFVTNKEFLVMVILLSMIFTFIYSVRLLLVFMFEVGKLKLLISESFILLFIVLGVSSVLSFVFGCFLFSNFLYLFVTSSGLKLLIFFLSFLFVAVGIYTFKSGWFFTNMFGLNVMTFSVNKMLLFLKYSFSLFEKVFMEVLFVNLFAFNLKYFPNYVVVLSKVVWFVDFLFVFLLFLFFIMY